MTNCGSVLIVDEVHQSLFNSLYELGYTPDYQPLITREELLKIINNYVGLIIRSKTKVDKELLNQATSLRFIGRAGAGLDLIDLEETALRNVKVFAANEGNRVAVAEHVLGMILCLLNRIHIADHEVKVKIWKREENRGTELFGKTVGIVGFGNNGFETAQRFAAFGCEVLVFDKYKTIEPIDWCQQTTMQEIFEKADILSLHIPLTFETQQMVNEEYLSNFSNQIYLINASRGEIVESSAVVKALKTNQLKGVCLDVLENEKFSTFSEKQLSDFEYLRDSDKVLFTPHIAGWTFESYKKINDVLIEKISEFKKGF